MFLVRRWRKRRPLEHDLPTYFLGILLCFKEKAKDKLFGPIGGKKDHLEAGIKAFHQFFKDLRLLTEDIIILSYPLDNVLS